MISLLQPSTSLVSSQTPAISTDASEMTTREALGYQILQRTLNLEGVQSSPLAATDTKQNAPSTAPPVDAEAFSQRIIEQRQFSLEVNLNAAPEVVDPLVLDLAGNGFSTSGLRQTVRFDLDADGKLDNMSVPTGDDALLALDRNGNGRIDDGRELFGDQRGAANGFAELAKLDDNADGRIDSQDSLFSQLRLLRFDQAGRQQLMSLSEAGVSAIELTAQNVDIAIGTYDRIAQLGHFEFTDGRRGQAADLLLAKR